MTPRRSNHEGSIYQRTSDGLWIGVAHVGYDASGKPLRKYVSSKKRPEVVKQLKELRRSIDDGQLVKENGVNVAELFGGADAHPSNPWEEETRRIDRQRRRQTPLS